MTGCVKRRPCKPATPATAATSPKDSRNNRNYMDQKVNQDDQRLLDIYYNEIKEIRIFQSLCASQYVYTIHSMVQTPSMHLRLILFTDGTVQENLHQYRFVRRLRASLLMADLTGWWVSLLLAVTCSTMFWLLCSLTSAKQPPALPYPRLHPNNHTGTKNKSELRH
jgi:hypothetical protein